MFFPLYYVAIRGNAWVLSHGDFWTKHWASLAVVVLFLNETSPPLSSPLPAPPVQPPGEAVTVSGLPLQHALMPCLEGRAARKCEVWWRWPSQGWVMHGNFLTFQGTTSERKWNFPEAWTGDLCHKLLIWGVRLAFNPVINLEGGRVHAGLSFSEFKSIRLLIYFVFIRAGLFYCQGLNDRFPGRL